jgi:hypothetical protein
MRSPRQLLTRIYTNILLDQARERWRRHDALPEAPTPTPAQASPPRRRRSRYRRDPVETVVRELWPGGVPDTTATADALKILGDTLHSRGIAAPSNTTLLRALGRR